MSIKGKCMCGLVKVEIDGYPIAMILCHCKVCRSWSACPVNGATLFKPDQVKILGNKQFLDKFSLSEGHDRKWCNNCGGHILTDHTNTYGVIDVYGSILDNFEFKPTAHFNYESTILPIKDGLPKFKDFPKDFGGSRVLLEE